LFPQKKSNLIKENVINSNLIREEPMLKEMAADAGLAIKINGR
jgi:hypothetical protein